MKLKKQSKPTYVTMTVRVDANTKAKYIKHAKERGQTLSRAVQMAMEDDMALSGSLGPCTWQQDTSLTISGAGPEVYQSPQWLEAGKPVDPARGNWLVRTLNRLFG